MRIYPRLDRIDEFLAEHSEVRDFYKRVAYNLYLGILFVLGYCGMVWLYENWRW